MKNLPLIFCIFVFGCTGGGSNNPGSPSVSNTPATVAEQPKTYTLDFPGQIARIDAEGSGDEQIRKNIADIDPAITYELLNKSAAKYAGKAWACKGKILQIQEKDGLTAARVALDGFGNKTVQIAGNLTNDFVEDNQVYVVGYLTGEYSYKSVANYQITIPGLAARAMIKPNEVSKYQSQPKGSEY